MKESSWRRNSILKLIIRLKGGSGSGNYGHSGRPGEVGGSASDGGVRRIQDESDENYLERMSKNWASSLNSQDKAAIRWYRTGGAYEMNRQLRTGDPVTNKYGKRILKLVNDAPVLEDSITLYRGTGYALRETDKGIVSTTLDFYMAKNEFAAGMPNGIVQTLHIEPGIKLAYIDSKNSPSHGAQSEVLLEKNLHFDEISRDTRLSKGGITLTYIKYNVHR